MNIPAGDGDASCWYTTPGNLDCFGISGPTLQDLSLERYLILFCDSDHPINDPNICQHSPVLDLDCRSITKSHSHFFCFGSIPSPGHIQGDADFRVNSKCRSSRSSQTYFFLGCEYKKDLMGRFLK